MLFTPLTFTLLVTAASAIDIRFHYEKPCSGKYVGGWNVKPNVCLVLDKDFKPDAKSVIVDHIPDELHDMVTVTMYTDDDCSDEVGKFETSTASVMCQRGSGVRAAKYQIKGSSTRIKRGGFVGKEVQRVDRVGFEDGSAFNVTGQDGETTL